MKMWNFMFWLFMILFIPFGFVLAIIFSCFIWIIIIFIIGCIVHLIEGILSLLTFGWYKKRKKK